MKKITINKQTLRGIIVLIIVVLSVIYYRYTWIINKNEGINDVLQIARSIEATLPKGDLETLMAKPIDPDNPQWHGIKNILKSIVKVNQKARFAYIYTEQNGKTIILANSRPENSKESAPPGEEFLKANKSYHQAVNGGNEFISDLVTDKWGRWISVIIPIKDETTGGIIATFGMDFNASTWNNRIIYEMAESSVLILLLLSALYALSKVDDRNTALHLEIAERKQAEKELQESETRFRSLFENMVEGFAFCKMIYEAGQPKDFMYLEVNQSFERLTGLKDVSGKRVSELIPGIQRTDPELFETYNRVALTGNPEQFEFYLEALKM
jgi:PAS domain-containing protein